MSEYLDLVHRCLEEYASGEFSAEDALVRIDNVIYAATNLRALESPIYNNPIGWAERRRNAS